MHLDRVLKSAGYSSVDSTGEFDSGGEICKRQTWKLDNIIYILDDKK